MGLNDQMNLRNAPQLDETAPTGRDGEPVPRFLTFTQAAVPFQVLPEHDGCVLSYVGDVGGGQVQFPHGLPLGFRLTLVQGGDYSFILGQGGDVAPVNRNITGAMFSNGPWARAEVVVVATDVVVATGDLTD